MDVDIVIVGSFLYTPIVNSMACLVAVGINEGMNSLLDCGCSNRLLEDLLRVAVLLCSW